jgi:hypothetical protein
MEHHNMQAELMKSKLNLTLKPWEASQLTPDMTTSWTQVSLSVYFSYYIFFDLNGTSITAQDTSIEDL